MYDIMTPVRYLRMRLNIFQATFYTFPYFFVYPQKGVFKSHCYCTTSISVVLVNVHICYKSQQETDCATYSALLETWCPWDQYHQH